MKRGLGLTAVLLAAIACVLFGVGWWYSQPAEVKPSAEETVLPTVVQSTASSPTAGPPKVAIAPAPPVKIAIPELNFSLKVVSNTTQEMAVVYNQNHPGSNVASAVYATDFYKAGWASDYGAMPGMDADNTVYITCHSSAIRDLPCNVLAPKGAVKEGYHLVVTTRNATVTYLLEKPVLKEKASLGEDQDLRRVRPGWIVLTVCMLQDGRRTEYSWAMFGHVVEEEKR